jgi:imidazolonepropionase
MTTLITNIKQLLGTRPTSRPLRGKELAELPAIENAYLIIEDGSIADFGTMNTIQNQTPIATGAKIENQVDASGQLVLPCWCDSHTHLFMLPVGKKNLSIR